MLSDFTGAEKVYICCGYTDLRQGIDGLSALVQLEFELDPFSNTLFLFCGRRRDRIKAYIQLCLAISAQALTTKAASPTRPVTDNPKYTFRCWLLRLGFIGDEFETARTHLLANLTGNAAWRQAS